MSGTVDRERRGNVVVWTLVNPQKNNAVDNTMLELFGRLADEVERDRTIRAAILCGSGELAFCAGADIADWSALDPVDFARLWIGRGHLLLDRLARLPVPLIGALHGWVFGGGFELAAICDVRVASSKAVFALPESAIGVTPGWSGVQRLARLLPQALLREMSLTGGRLTAERLYSVGFLNEIVDDPLSRAIDIGARVADLAPRAVEATKLVLSAFLGEGREQAVDRLASGLVAGTLDKEEGIKSFRDKRKPIYTGR